MAELSHKFPGYFDRENCIEWVKDMFARELRHHHGMDDSSKKCTFYTKPKILNSDLFTWFLLFAKEVEKRMIHQQLHVKRLCKPTKECVGIFCLIFAKKSIPTIQGRISLNNFTYLEC